MRGLVERWSAHERRRKPDGPDGLTIDGEHVQLEGKPMSVIKELPETDFNTVIRLVHNAGRERVLSLRNATYEALRRLGVRRNLSKAVARMPAGSDQVDLGSIFAWMDSVTANDTAAVDQVVRIDATAVARTGA